MRPRADLTRVILRGSDRMAIVLAILKWIGIVLGGVLGMALLLGVLVVFVPVRYRLSGNNQDVLRYQFRVSWLCRVVSIVKKADSKEIWLRLLGIPVVRLAGDSPGTAERTSTGTPRTDRQVGEEREGCEEPDTRQQSGKPGKNYGTGQAQTGKKKSVPGKKGTSGKKHKKRKKAFSFDILSGIINFVRDTENKRIFRKMRNELQLLLRYLAPRKVRGCFVIGTGDPSSTGLLIGGISLLPFAYQEGIEITPDFDDRVFAADGMIKGQIRVFYFIRLCIRLYRDKELRKLWNKIQKLKKEAA